MDISSLRERNIRNTLTVSELNAYIKNIFENDRSLSSVSVKGEISNFVYHKSGHLYFTLKDVDGQIKAVMFRSAAQRLKFIPENGMKVVVFGSVSLYGRDGTYQIYVNQIDPDGIGALYLAYEQLKEKLSLEGLFDDAHKKPLPRYPERIGVITSPTGAAIRDIINVIIRRFPLSKIYLYPSQVQGASATRNLIEALDYFDSANLVDVIIIGRGGGSIEDLWSFNDEALARRIYSLTIPIISAVGHETDFTICDFVADMRAPTPSAAAELAVPDIRDLIYRIDGFEERLSLLLNHFVTSRKEKLDKIIESLEKHKNITDNYRQILIRLQEKLFDSYKNMIKDQRASLVLLSEKLNALSPLLVLKRGYSIIESESGTVKSVDELSPQDDIRLRLYDGTVTATVKKIKRGT